MTTRTRNPKLAIALLGLVSLINLYPGKTLAQTAAAGAALPPGGSTTTTTTTAAATTTTTAAATTTTTAAATTTAHTAVSTSSGYPTCTVGGDTHVLGIVDANGDKIATPGEFEATVAHSARSGKSKSYLEDMKARYEYAKDNDGKAAFHADNGAFVCATSAQATGYAGLRLVWSKEAKACVFASYASGLASGLSKRGLEKVRADLIEQVNDATSAYGKAVRDLIAKETAGYIDEAEFTAALAAERTVVEGLIATAKADAITAANDFTNAAVSSLALVMGQADAALRLVDDQLRADLTALGTDVRALELQQERDNLQWKPDIGVEVVVMGDIGDPVQLTQDGHDLVDEDGNPVLARAQFGGGVCGRFVGGAYGRKVGINGYGGACIGGSGIGTFVLADVGLRVFHLWGDGAHSVGGDIGILAGGQGMGVSSENAGVRTSRGNDVSVSVRAFIETRIMPGLRARFEFGGHFGGIDTEDGTGNAYGMLIGGGLRFGAPRRPALSPDEAREVLKAREKAASPASP